MGAGRDREIPVEEDVIFFETGVEKRGLFSYNK